MRARTLRSIGAAAAAGLVVIVIVVVIVVSRSGTSTHAVSGGGTTGTAPSVPTLVDPPPTTVTATNPVTGQPVTVAVPTQVGPVRSTTVVGRYVFVLDTDEVWRIPIGGSEMPAHTVPLVAPQPPLARLGAGLVTLPGKNHHVTYTVDVTRMSAVCRAVATDPGACAGTPTVGK